MLDKESLINIVMIKKKEEKEKGKELYLFLYLQKKFSYTLKIFGNFNSKWGKVLPQTQRYGE